MGPIFKLVQVPLDGILSLRRVDWMTQRGVICILAEGALDPAMSLMILNNAGPNTDACRMPVVTNLHLDIEPLTTALWM